jgi:hypothetical protein
VFKRFSYALLIAAVLTATGTHWLFLQSLAWTSMLAENLQSGSVFDAVERTFDGHHPCGLCKQISKGKQAEKKTEFRAEWKKLEFSYAPSFFVFSAPVPCQEVRASNDSAPFRAHSPPVPPPRQLSA